MTRTSEEIDAMSAELDYYVKVWRLATEMSGHLRAVVALLKAEAMGPTKTLVVKWIEETLEEFKKLEESRR